MKKQIKIGNVKIGGGSEIAIQTMSDKPTTDIDAVVAQALECQGLGCDIFRVAVPDMAAARCIKEIKNQINMPLVADIHFDYKLALATIENGTDKVRINPANMPREHIKKFIDVVKESGTPVRIGTNGGSAGKKLTVDELIGQTMDCIRFFEDNGYDNLVLSIKTSCVAETLEAYKKIDKLCHYPLHIGVTEAGTLEYGILKSAVGIGALLLDGIGDTVRVSLNADPKQEIIAAKKILRAVGIDKNYVEVISCPRCGRCTYDTLTLANKVGDMTADSTKPLKIAVMGCIVNGPGEASHCHLGIAFCKDKAALFKMGKVYKTLDAKEAEEEFLEQVGILMNNE